VRQNPQKTSQFRFREMVEDAKERARGDTDNRFAEGSTCPNSWLWTNYGQYGNNPERPCQPLEAGPNIRVADIVHYSLNER
jgi:hypothetical protein